MASAEIPMILGIGTNNIDRGRIGARQLNAGFTLIEILLVIALIVLVTGVATYQMGDYDTNEKPLKQWVWEAIFDARMAAMESNKNVTLTFDQDSRSFKLKTDTRPSAVKTNDTLDEQASDSKATKGNAMTIPPNHKGDVEVIFYPLMSDEGTGSFSAEYDDEPIEEIIFSSSGASTPVRIEIEYDDNDTIHLSPDPFASYFIDADE